MQKIGDLLATVQQYVARSYITGFVEPNSQLRNRMHLEANKKLTLQLFSSREDFDAVISAILTRS